MITITSVESQTEVIDATSRHPTHGPDPDWIHVDQKGNEHRWIMGDDGDWTLPTLEWRVDKYGECPCCGHDSLVHECGYFVPSTGEEVVPGRKHIHGRIQGRTWIRGPTKVSGTFESDRRRDIRVRINLSRCRIQDGPEHLVDFVLTGFAYVTEMHLQTRNGRAVWVGEWKAAGDVGYRAKGG